MKTSSIWIHAPFESEVRAVVGGEDFAGVVLVDFQARRRDVLEVFDLAGQPRIGGIGQRLQLHGWKLYTEHVFSQGRPALRWSHGDSEDRHRSDLGGGARARRGRTAPPHRYRDP